MTVYLLYDSYPQERDNQELVAVFSSRERAEECIANFNFPGCVYEIFEAKVIE